MFKFLIDIESLSQVYELNLNSYLHYIKYTFNLLWHNTLVIKLKYHIHFHRFK